MKTDQQTFDFVVTHLRKQNQPAVDPIGGNCMYRYESLSCAAGCLIPDELYTPDLEGTNVTAGEMLRLMHKLGYKNNLLLREMQRAHDKWTAGTPWGDIQSRAFHSIANNFELDKGCLA
jgi:hypothetical protein